ncbi:MAG: YlbF family regulator [Planctomycetota bacterium]|jgi:cell fate (sporulation/competence/biofilm development) regulator YlbF (YheA/YmcA/DUF963 family)
MEEILTLAKKLGQAVAAHERCRALKEARAAFESDETARKLQQEYDEAAILLQQRLAEGKPLEPDEKRREADLRGQVAGNATLTALVRAQADFHELMVSVNQALEGAIGS